MTNQVGAFQEFNEAVREVRIAIQEEVRTEPRCAAFAKGQRAFQANKSRYVNPYRHGSFTLQCEWSAGYDDAARKAMK